MGAADHGSAEEDSYRSVHLKPLKADASFAVQINGAPSVFSLLRAFNAEEGSVQRVFMKQDEKRPPTPTPAPHERDWESGKIANILCRRRFHVCQPSNMYAGGGGGRRVEQQRRSAGSSDQSRLSVSKVNCVGLKRHNAILLMLITDADSFRAGGGLGGVRKGGPR